MFFNVLSIAYYSIKWLASPEFQYDLSSNWAEPCCGVLHPVGSDQKSHQHNWSENSSAVGPEEEHELQSCAVIFLSRWPLHSFHNALVQHRLYLKSSVIAGDFSISEAHYEALQ